ncbi:MAG TPA: hypothetical protein VK250_08970 [Nitrososphaeraceae archaeon]|nr:hypothetical protein [Nitrososphaeraceae archaeon]
MIDKYTKEEIPFEYLRFINGMDKITSTTWNIIEGENPIPDIKFKIQALSLLKECYENRIKILIGGSDTDMNAKKHLKKSITMKKWKIIL